MLEDILEDATNILGIPGQYGELEGTGWVVGLNETDAVLVRHIENSGRISFEYRLGEIPERNRDHVLALMLRFNYLGAQLAGLRTAMTDDFVAVLIVDKEDDHIESNAVANILGLLSENGPAWRKLIEAAVRDGSTHAMSAPDLANPSQVFV